MTKSDPTPTVAILGASSDPSKYGNLSVRAHRSAGFHVFPVHPTEESIDGLKAYRSVSEIPVKLNRISMYVPPQVGLRLLEEIAAKGCDEFFLNPGSESDELLARAEELGLRPIQACSIVDAQTRPSGGG